MFFVLVFLITFDTSPDSRTFPLSIMMTFSPLSISSIDELKFGFSNINFKSWKDNSTLQPKLEFTGPKVSVENLILKD